MNYAFKNGTSYRGAKDPNKIGRALEQIRKSNDGKLKPADVVDRARAETSPLHPIFTWDDTAAAEEYRRWEARELIRQVVIVHPETKESAPAFVNVSVEEGRYYQSSGVLVENVDEYQSALELATRKLKEAARSLDDLKRLSASRDDRMALLAIAMQALGTVQETIQRLQ